MTGWGSSWIASISWARLSWMKWMAPTGPRSLASAGVSSSPVMLAPAQKPLPRPATTTARTVRSSRSPANTSRNSRHHRGGQRVVPVGIVELDQRDVLGRPGDRDLAHGATAMRSAKPVGACAPMLACSNRPQPSAPSHEARATWSMLPNGMRGTIAGSVEVGRPPLGPAPGPSTARAPSRRRRSRGRGAAGTNPRVSISTVTGLPRHVV